MTETLTQQNLPGMPDSGRYDADVTPKQDKRYRVQFRFWLDANKTHESKIGQALDDMKSKRKYQPFIRDAIRLMLSLMTGQIAILLELFPGIVAQIENRANSAEVLRVAGMEGIIAQQERQILELQAQLSKHEPIAASDELEQIVQGMQRIEQAMNAHNSPQNAANVDMRGLTPVQVQSSVQPGNQGIRHIAGMSAAPLPDFDDLDDTMLMEVVKDESAGQRAAQNFIASMLSLQE